MVNSKEIGKTSNISLSKDLIDVKAHNKHRVRVLKPYLFVLACLRRLPRLLRPRATWAQVWREILNSREVHGKKKNKDGFPFP